MKNDLQYSFDEKIKGILDIVLSDYGDDQMDRMDTFRQPDQEVIIDILNKLQRIIFPGYSRKGTHKSHSTVHNLSALIEETASMLKDQIAIVIWNPDVPAEETEQKAQDLTCEFFRQIPKVRALLKTDLDAFYDGDPAAYSKDEIIIAYPGFQTVTINRLAHELFELHVPLIPRIMTEYAHSRFGIDIHPGATIGHHFFIDHGTGIVVGETTVIGNYVKVYQGVTLGALSTRGGQSLRGKRRHPTIEDNVTIYAGASILGGNTIIGEGSVIGSNVFITKSIPAGTKLSVSTQELNIKGPGITDGDF